MQHERVAGSGRFERLDAADCACLASNVSSKTAGTTNGERRAFSYVARFTRLKPLALLSSLPGCTRRAVRLAASPDHAPLGLLAAVH